ncbi:MAG: cellulase family glycosylhydrolase [Candidatus Omnitrophota bacterium]
MKRRHFLTAASALMASAAIPIPARTETSETITASHIPPLKGFNLLEKFTLHGNKPYVERDFEWMAQWGFNFVRLPMDYRCWTDSADPKKLDEKVLKEIDQVVEWGKQYKIHINLNLHRAPGYCVNPPEEPLDLWTSEAAQDQFCFQWRNFAERYKNVSSQNLSFDLLNEPKDMPEEQYAPVVRKAVAAIRSVSPDRLVVIDGLRWGQVPVFSLVDLKIAQSTRGYQPMRISHYKASWIGGSDKWPEPTWPLKEGERVWDKERLRQQTIEPWKKLEAQGAGVHVGEWGVYKFTPHAVALAWMEDVLSLWKEAGWGYSQWNLRGTFGIVDSNRDDVKYEDFQGHSLDRKMLELLLKYK